MKSRWHFHFSGVRFEPRDLWLGLYWKTGMEANWQVVTCYVCLLPTLPIIFVLERKLS